MKAAPRVAVIGAGMAGLTCARELLLRSAQVTLFDKGRAPGGRLTTGEAPPHGFDLGAQYFTVHDPRFADRVGEWTRAGVCEPWRGRLVASADAHAPFRALVTPVERFVGVPGMRALGQHLAAGVELRPSQRVERIERRGTELRLFGTVGAPGVTLGPRAATGAGDDDLGAYDRVAICVPSTQAAALLAELSPGKSISTTSLPATATSPLAVKRLTRLCTPPLGVV